MATHGTWHVRVATCLCLTPRPGCILARGASQAAQGPVSAGVEDRPGRPQGAVSFCLLRRKKSSCSILWQVNLFPPPPPPPNCQVAALEGEGGGVHEKNTPLDTLPAHPTEFMIACEIYDYLRHAGALKKPHSCFTGRGYQKRCNSKHSQEHRKTTHLPDMFPQATTKGVVVSRLELSRGDSFLIHSDPVSHHCRWQPVLLALLPA